MLIQLIAKTTACCVILATIGCGSNWRTHTAQQLQPRPMFNTNAPEWVKGINPSVGTFGLPSRIYFIGRSRTPDIPFNSEWRWRPASNRNDSLTPDRRTGYTVMDERQAVQSARDDVYDQIRQRLAPRNMGNASNLVVDNIESGTCVTCGTTIPVYRTDVSICNDSCSHGAGPCNTSNIKTLSVGAVSSCSDCHKQVASCAGCGTLVHAITQTNRTPDYLAGNLTPLNRDLNIININLDSMMPSLAAYLSEDEVYFEKWHVHDGHDGFGRPFANGRDEWQSYKCWMLCSIPAEEFYSIAKDFRVKYEHLYELALERAVEDRARRMLAEDESRELGVTRQGEERVWNREDEIITRDHAIEIDKDRQLLPGRRFTLENE